MMLVAVSQMGGVNIRTLQHRDQFGNVIGSLRTGSCQAYTKSVIAEPDRSNPTRHRWERPLDTIRSFEAAIDNNYKRKSYARPG